MAQERMAEGSNTPEEIDRPPTAEVTPKKGRQPSQRRNRRTADNGESKPNSQTIDNIHIEGPGTVIAAGRDVIYYSGPGGGVNQPEAAAPVSGEVPSKPGRVLQEPPEVPEGGMTEEEIVKKWFKGLGFNTPEEVKEFFDNRKEFLRKKGVSEEDIQDLLAGEIDRSATYPDKNDRGAWEEWVRKRLGAIERTGAEYSGQNVGNLFNIIQIKASEDFQADLMKEINARIAVHNGALLLSRLNLEGCVGFIGGQQVEFVDIISKEKYVEEIMSLFDEKLIEIFSVKERYVEEDGEDESGNKITISRKEQIKAFGNDLQRYREEFIIEIAAKEHIDLRKKDKDIGEDGSILRETFKNTKKDRKARELKEQLETAIKLTENTYRILGLAAAAEVPEYTPEGQLVIPNKTKIRRRIDPADPNKNVLEKIPLTEKNNKGVKRGSGDFAFWRMFWMPAYAEMMERGKQELRQYTRTGFMDFVNTQFIAALPEEEGVGTAFENSARKRKMPDIDSNKATALGMKELLKAIRKNKITSADWGTWVGNIKPADEVRATMESLEGYLHTPTRENVLALASKAFTHIKDKPKERRLIISDLVKGVVRFNSTEEIVKKYYGEKAMPWNSITRRFAVNSFVHRGFITDENAEEIMHDTNPTWLKMFLESYNEVGKPAMQATGLAFLQTFLKQLVTGYKF